ncbi:putative bifunctional diguanylate cyclase/phosphodiesterase [Brevibacillus invocatus]|uniref:putative bifunctional diguanylate cyclase/phosphodiesterase n=1 Tax=Brevibacillus invocatus TaxID=173959 RepID=UPI003B8A60B5
MHEAQKEVHRYKFYHNQMDQKLLERLLLEHDLHHALDKEEFHLYYQPQTDLRTGHILSFEALIRWKHPRHGWVSPIDFIPIAEETGLIVPIGEWVLKTACKQLKAWHEQGLDQIGVSVNLSTRQFFQQNLVDTIKRVLDETALSAKYLELEITESMTINESHAIEILQNIKQLGVKIAVDDFGTGYSSLYYLKELPLDRLKIDQSFVRDMMKDKHHAAIISMIVSIAQQLQIEVIAEGVENMEQLTFLWSHHCRQGQGYLFSPPIPAEEVSKRFEDIQERTISYSNTLHIVSSFS